MSDQVKRNFLHPMNLGRVSNKHFKKVQTGNYNGTRLTHFESSSSIVNRPYQQGILLEVPGQQPKMIYGSFDQINDIASQVKSDPDKVAQSLRFAGNQQSGHYYLNEKPPSQPVYRQLSGPELKEASLADRMYSGSMNDDRLRTQDQLELRAMKQHIREENTKMNPHKDGDPGHDEWNQQNDPFNQSNSPLAGTEANSETSKMELSSHQTPASQREGAE